jgi:hypothetical protein
MTKRELTRWPRIFGGGNLPALPVRKNICPPVADRIFFEKLKPRLAGLFFGARQQRSAPQYCPLNILRALRPTLVALSLSALACPTARAGADVAGPAWPDTFAVRVEALAVLQTLNAELLSQDSATATLQRWCELHRLAASPRIVAIPVPGAPKPATDAQRMELRVGLAEPVRYRHVRLTCGSLVLSEADNWYVPARLSPAMNHRLETTDTPFGAVVHELHFQRHTLSARLLWMPLPSGWEMNSRAEPQVSATLRVPGAVLEHRAVLTLQDGTPFSEVVETYTGNVLAFPLPQLPEPSGSSGPAH